MQVISEIRSAHARRDQETMTRLVLEQRSSERYADVLTYALGLDAKVLAPERLVQWLEWTPTPSTTHEKAHDGLWWIDEDEWCLRVCGVVLATHETLDLQQLQHVWSTVPARAALPVWEDWAREHAPEHLEAPRRAIEAKEAWCRGDATDDDLRVAWDAAGDAAWGARAAASAAAGAAAWAAVSAADLWDARAAAGAAAWGARAAASAAAGAAAWAAVSAADLWDARAAAGAAAWAARGAAWTARDAARVAAWAAARDAEYQKWYDAWTSHVIDQILNPNTGD
jgi:hypothetical protein